MANSWIDLTGKVALVTGAASGIGRAAAENIAQAGAKVILLDRDEAGVAKAAAALRQSGHDAVERVLDVSQGADWQALGEWIAADVGRIDILVNSAGIARFDKVGADIFPTYHEVFAVNVEGVLRGMALALDYMRPVGRGAIVNVSSTASLKGNPAMASYGASKAAVSHFTRSAALEVNRAGLDIRINAVLPGFTDTGMAQQIHDQFDSKLGGREETMKVFASGRTAQPQEIADLILYLVSDRASFVSGSTYNIDRAQSA